MSVPSGIATTEVEAYTSSMVSSQLSSLTATAHSARSAVRSRYCDDADLLLVVDVEGDVNGLDVAVLGRRQRVADRAQFAILVEHLAAVLAEGVGELDGDRDGHRKAFRGRGWQGQRFRMRRGR